MEISVISGINYPKYTERGNIVFSLAHHILANKEYMRYYRDCNKYLIMDNSAAELGKSIGLQDVLNAARMVNADELWLPDKLYDKKETLKLTKAFIKLLDNKDEFVLVGLSQGKNLKEWLSCYKEMLKMPEIDVMAISKYSVECFKEITKSEDFAICRMACIDYLHKHKLVKKKLHIAGANERITQEISYYKKYPMVRSIDSNIMFKLGCLGIKIDECEVEPEERLNHDIKDLTASQKKLIEYNIKKVKEVL